LWHFHYGGGGDYGNAERFGDEEGWAFGALGEGEVEDQGDVAWCAQEGLEEGLDGGGEVVGDRDEEGLEGVEDEGLDAIHRGQFWGNDGGGFEEDKCLVIKVVSTKTCQDLILQIT
jgi:hypothetical protein